MLRAAKGIIDEKRNRNFANNGIMPFLGKNIALDHLQRQFQEETAD